MIKFKYYSLLPFILKKKYKKLYVDFDFEITNANGSTATLCACQIISELTLPIKKKIIIIINPKYYSLLTFISKYYSLLPFILKGKYKKLYVDFIFPRKAANPNRHDCDSCLS